MKNLYHILELEHDATAEEIKTQYRFLVHAWHPDKFPNAAAKAKAEEKLKDINEAYKTLSDPLTRARYDRELNWRSSERAPTPQAGQPQSERPQPTHTPTPKQEKESPQADSFCEGCWVRAETRAVSFHQIIGLLIFSTMGSVKGEFCRSCIETLFWKTTGVTMLLGWWSVKSFLFSPFIILFNLIQYLSSLSMQSPKEKKSNPSLLWIIITIGGFLTLCIFGVSLLFD